MCNYRNLNVFSIVVNLQILPFQPTISPKSSFPDRKKTCSTYHNAQETKVTKFVIITFRIAPGYPKY